MINSPQTIPNAQVNSTIPDSADRASSLVGYNINDYVFGGVDGFDNQTTNQNAPLNKELAKKKKSNTALGVIALMALGFATYAGVRKGKNLKVIPEKVNSWATDFSSKLSQCKEIFKAK